MNSKNTVRLIIWGLLFIIAFACGVIGLVNSKSRQNTYPYGYIEYEE